MFELSYGNKKLLPHLHCDLKLTIAPGALMVLQGENGIGKTTLLKDIHQTLATDSAMADQGRPDLFFDRRLGKFLDLFTYASGTERRTSFYENAIRQFGLEGKKDRMLSRLSGGEAQALKLITTLSLERKLYILDEAGQNLDREKTGFLKDVLLGLISEGKSLLLAEHDLSWLPAGAIVIGLKLQDGILREERRWNI